MRLNLIAGLVLLCSISFTILHGQQNNYGLAGYWKYITKVDNISLFNPDKIYPQEHDKFGELIIKSDGKITVIDTGGTVNKNYRFIDAASFANKKKNIAYDFLTEDYNGIVYMFVEQKHNYENKIYVFAKSRYSDNINIPFRDDINASEYCWKLIGIAENPMFPKYLLENNITSQLNRLAFERNGRTNKSHLKWTGTDFNRGYIINTDNKTLNDYTLEHKEDGFTYMYVKFKGPKYLYKKELPKNYYVYLQIEKIKKDKKYGFDDVIEGNWEIVGLSDNTSDYIDCLDECEIKNIEFKKDYKVKITLSDMKVKNLTWMSVEKIKYKQEGLEYNEDEEEEYNKHKYIIYDNNPQISDEYIVKQIEGEIYLFIRPRVAQKRYDDTKTFYHVLVKKNEITEKKIETRRDAYEIKIRSNMH